MNDSLEEMIKKQRMLIRRMNLICMENSNISEEEFLKRKKEYDDYTDEIWNMKNE